jgi:hypothetical protein
MPRPNPPARPFLGFLFLLTAISLLPTPTWADAVYRWTDADGVIHISSEKPPQGVKAQRIEIHNSPSSKSSSGRTTSGGSSSTSRSTASSAQAAERSQVLASLKTRECVIALESLDRLTSGTQPTSAAEIARLTQTADANCSRDPVRRREQEDMAAKLRVANGPECVKARNELADMMAQRSKTAPDQLRAQQAFVDAHCVPPVQ